MASRRSRGWQLCSRSIRESRRRSAPRRRNRKDGLLEGWAGAGKSAGLFSFGKYVRLAMACGGFVPTSAVHERAGGFRVAKDGSKDGHGVPKIAQTGSGE